MTFDWGSAEFSEKKAIEPDFTYAIDYVLDEKMVAKIYDGWDEKEQGSLIDYGGGVRAITAQMVYDAGEDFLKSLKGVGVKRAQETMEKINYQVSQVPYS